MIMIINDNIGTENNGNDNNDNNNDNDDNHLQQFFHPGPGHFIGNTFSHQSLRNRPELLKEG